MSTVIIGCEAIASGIVTSHQLRTRYRPIFPNVHAPNGIEPTLRDRTEGAWLWTRRRGIVTGLAASALHGAAWVDDSADIEVIFDCTRPPRGIVARNERIDDDEWRRLGDLAIATPARTAFDLGRFQRGGALGRLDALMRACPFSVDDVMLLTERYRGGRGVARLKAVLPLVDGGAESPRESWWRQLVIEAGFPLPDTQIGVTDEHGRHVRRLDFGWRRYGVALEYDGAHHQSDRAQYLKDRAAMPVLRRLGWHVIGIVREDNPVVVLGILRDVMAERGWRGKVQIPRSAYQYAETASAALRSA
ncbi:hypothetical protein FK535_25675 [Mycolicibacterium sp. 018/SC-01/001]|uniref:hypothetical protein n=1 Tax=Mycolicibacterium sp. 018/SC-01/001 TaxID=2592069 RepID=UPI00117EAD86|nr:hypothetical protein [Mycolicibacterium sp. 018/SC-01/001]TRW78349.1 hypothetical protein FK535_25675 [Mycolicibacterium sp. 018/SC-01/001]